MIVQTKFIYEYATETKNRESSGSIDINGIYALEEVGENTKATFYGGVEKTVNIPYPELYLIWKENKSIGFYDNKTEKKEKREEPEIKKVENNLWSLEILNTDQQEYPSYLRLNSNFLIVQEIKDVINDTTGVEHLGSFGICKEKYHLNIYLGKLFNAEQVAKNVDTELILYLSKK